MIKRHSIRDLRSAFCTDALRGLGGDYDYTARRWRFASVYAAQEAAERVGAYGLFVVRLPGARDHHDALKTRGGFSVVASNDEGALKRGVSTYVFSTLEGQTDALAHLGGHLSASREEQMAVADELRRSAADLYVGGRERVISELGERVYWRHELEQLRARKIAGTAARPANRVDEADSRESAIADARRFAGAFIVREDPPAAEIAGLLVGRSAHHLAVETEDGRGVILERWRISTPLTLQYGRERAFDRGAPIHVVLADGAGDAIQLRGESDREMGVLRLQGLRAAATRGFEAIARYEEFSTQEDVFGRVVAASEHVSLVMDEGATLVAGPKSVMGAGPLGAVIAAGPSWTVTKGQLRRRA
ncbi:MAG: hypothetical protein WAJ85_10895 [Candidatus Baltobacteraceae bacterium]